jgi:alkylation response protein AidB-like acyl-CoA dehydrogenase
MATYILSFGSEAHKRASLPKMVRGEAIGSLGMTEPQAGSDLKAIRTRAVRDGEDFVINGQKVFISNGQLCDILVLATKTDSASGARGITLFLVEGDRPGFRRGRNLEKLGMHAQDTSELFFEDVRVPATNMLGGEGRGFAHDDQARAGTAGAGHLLGPGHRDHHRLDGGVHRPAQGVRPHDRRIPEHPVAELATEVAVARVFTDKCIALFMAGKLDPVEAAMAKMFTANLHCRAADECLQLFGGWGYMWELPIARAYADARVIKIAGGSIEIMKTIIARRLFADWLSARVEAAD